MGMSLLIAEEIAALFLMGAVGYLIVRLKILKTEDSKVLSLLAVYVFSPCVIVNSFQMEFSKSKITGMALCLVASFITQLIFMAVVWLFGKYFAFDPIEKASMIYTNAGYLTVPLVAGVMGDEWVIYATAYLVTFNLLMWSHGVLLVGKKENVNLKRILLNPNIISCIIGAVLFVTRVSLPSVVETCVSGLANMVGPASMLLIGMLIANLKLKEAFKQSRLYIICFIRLILLPLIIITVIKLSGVTVLHEYGRQILSIVLIAAAAPVANSVTQVALIFDRDARYASLINGMSVIFCVITLPLMIFIYELII